MRPWTKNDLVIVGPPSDPARIAGMKDGAEALKKIAEAKAKYVDLQDLGSREMAHTLWKRAGIHPSGSWFLKDESGGHMGFLAFAEKHEAYVIFGRIPFTTHKVRTGKMKILVDGDPTMRRPYIVMEANPRRFPSANAEGARALSDFLFTEEVQDLLARYGAEKNGGPPMFHPLPAVARTAG
jgi:tungstate transport system substrate-binding protein